MMLRAAGVFKMCYISPSLLHMYEVVSGLEAQDPWKL